MDRDTKTPSEAARKALNAWFQDRDAANREYARCLEHGITVLAGSTIPVALQSIPGAPDVLYLWGALPDPPQASVAVVGSRRAAADSLRSAYKLGRDLAEAGVTVVSGLARGVDSSVLEGAVAGGGRPGAVLGNGLPGIYPPENHGLARRIRESGGFIISEFALDAPPRRSHFPRRNRLISGLCQAVVVVQATLRSGSLITVGWALQQGKDVFVFPGSTSGAHHEGCHQLIRDGATLVTGARDVLGGLGAPPGGPLRDPELLGHNLNCASPRELMEQTGLPPAAALRLWRTLDEVDDEQRPDRE